MRLTEKDIVYIGICAKSHGLCYYVSRSVISDCLRPHGLQPTWLLCPWNPPGKDTGVLSFPSPGDLPSPGMEPGFRHCRQILFHLSHQGSPHISCHCSICFVLLCRKKKVAQPCPTLCDLMDYAVHGVLQARILEWVAPAPDLEIQISRGSSQPRDGTQVACIAGDSLLTGPQGKPKNTRRVAYLSPGDLSDPGIQPGSPALQADSLPTELSGKLIRLSQLIL